MSLCFHQGSARVIRCLQTQRDKLSTKCQTQLFDEEVQFSENIDFQYPMKKACSKEIDRFCKDVPHGNARVIRWVERAQFLLFLTPCPLETRSMDGLLAPKQFLLWTN
jgi:hypothetical protein